MRGSSDDVEIIVNVSMLYRIYLFKNISLSIFTSPKTYGKYLYINSSLTEEEGE